MWPKWLPIRARLPLVAQLAGAGALFTAIAMPSWTDVASPSTPIAVTTPSIAAAPAPLVGPVAPVTPAIATPERPAHLNLDVRHNFRNVELTVSVDDKQVIDARLEGAGRKFGVFGSRGERSFTRSLELEPGVRVVRLHVRSAAAKFDHTRVERFELGSAAVAAMRITVDKNGLDVMTDRPPVPVAVNVPPPPPALMMAAAPPAQAPAPPPNRGGVIADLYQTLRQLLIALAGFVASVASGFLLEEYLKSRNLSSFLAARGQLATPPEHREPTQPDAQLH